MPETFDLEQLFAEMESDLSRVTRAPGPDRAIRGARRRRRTTIVAVAAGVAVVAGGVAIGVGARGQDHAVEPITEVPAPAPLDGAHLSAATHGWTPTWGPLTRAVSMKLSMTFGGPCQVSVPGHGRGAIKALANPHDDAALAEMNDLGSSPARADAAWRSVERQLARCPSASPISSFSIPGAEGRTYRIAPSGSDTAPEYAWIVTTGRQIGELKIFGQSEPLPAVNDPKVARALLAAIQDAEEYRVDPSSGGSARVEESDFARALGTWHTGWVSGDAPTSPLASTCYSRRWQRASWTSQHEGLGGNGRQDLAEFSTATQARAAARSLVNAFRGCGDARYTVSQRLANPRSLLEVASGPTVVWVAQHDDAVAVVRVPPGAAPPPRHVSVDVAGLMFAAITTYTAGSH